MTKEEYKEKARLARVAYDETMGVLNREYALSNNFVKIGDTVEGRNLSISIDKKGNITDGQDIKIVVDKMRITTPLSGDILPTCVYSGRPLTKQGKLSKKDQILFIGQTNVKLINGKEKYNWGK